MSAAALVRIAPIALVLTLASSAGLQAQSAASTAQAPASPGQHAGHGQEKSAAPQKPDSTAAKPSGAQPHVHPPAQDLPPFIPPLTDEDRRAAFPDVEGHAVHDRAVHYFVLFDQLEWQGGDGHGNAVSLDSKGWVGRDRDRLWFRAEGAWEDGRVGEAEAHVLYGRQFSRWWDIVAGVRQDVRPGPAQTWAAVGVQGLAPYWFEIEATAYVGASGRTQARFEVEYELLLTNRIALQPLVELELAGKDDPERGIGAGLTTTEVGLRLRYEFRRELAPYLGVTWNRKYGDTADFAAAAGERTRGTQAVAGLRLWF
jgi:copper resistance protein B